ncbi:MAG: lysophospholipid acyltransferase family protein [Firmicutes bacterium]|nr:lysophospholipid acyltransferase family protein [Bacillota bacterium]MDY2819913.1 lysophospholipid acyltransferase family protein [Hominisplanchenecus sp.]
MRRILLMIWKNIWNVPRWMIQLFQYADEKDTHTELEKYQFLRKITIHANRGGRVTIESSGQENIPEEDGFIIFPNHQGLFDVLAFIESCDHPFSVVMKKEVANIPFLKQVFAILDAKAIDRKNVRQGMQVILDVSEEVKAGRNYIIFAEGTRSKEGNIVQEFKGGSFKAAMRAKCPIIPAAIIDAFKPFDTHSTDHVKVQVHYLKPLYYEQYKNMKSTEIAAYVKEQIQEDINNSIE